MKIVNERSGVREIAEQEKKKKIVPAYHLSIGKTRETKVQQDSKANEIEKPENLKVGIIKNDNDRSMTNE